MLAKGQVKLVKMRVGDYMYPVTLTCTGTRIETQFGYNPKLQAEIKMMQGAKYHGFDETNPRKMWSVANSFRNWFQIKYLMGENPYAWYDRPVIEHAFERDLMSHQRMMVNHGMTYHYCFFAAEMGTGKTLAAIEIAERCGYKDIWYIGPRSGVKAVGLELIKWSAKVKIRMMTYEQLVTVIQGWKPGDPAPQMVILDESSKIKTPTAKRSQAAYHLTESMRQEHGIENSICLLLSGTPSPKSPIDWFWQCITGDSLISTSEGLIKAASLRRPFDAVVNGKEHHSNGFWSNGTRKCLKIKTREGYGITCTPDHKVLTDFDGLQIWREAGKCTPGTKIVLNNNAGYAWDGQGSFDDGYLLGLIFGDGCVFKDNKTSQDVTARISLWEDDMSIMGTILGMLPIGTNPTQMGNQYTLQNAFLTALVREWGVGTDKQINDAIMQASSDFQRGLLRGFFDSDGSMASESMKLSFSQTDDARTSALIQMLINFGIKVIRTKRANVSSNLPGQKTVSQPYNEVRIYGDATARFSRQIGFYNSYKSARLKRAMDNRKHKEYSHTCEVVSIEDAGEHEVFDCEVEDVHCFSANGMIVHNCEVACPGFIKEGDIHKFKNRLCLVEQRESLSGGMYPHLISWLDDDKKCKTCGQYADHGVHMLHSKKDAVDATLNKLQGFKFGGKAEVAATPTTEAKASSVEPHAWAPSKNEVAYLYERMKGLVIVLFKKDCMDLPEKRYVELRAKPTVDMIRAARMITAQSRRAVQALTLLRELSDGFQYEEVETGEVHCSACTGVGEREIPVPDDDVNLDAPTAEVGKFTLKMMPCDKCDGSGYMPKMSREAHFVGSPKDELLIDLLEDHEEVGRCIVWGGFQATIDRIVDLCHKQSWSTLRIDGRGYHATDALGNALDANECLIAMDASHKDSKALREKHDRLCVVSNAKAGGMALTFTASPSEIFYSNGFDGEARFQAEDRFHRRGADKNRGCTIYDIICLPSDLLVLNNLKKKRKLQDMSLGELSLAMEAK